DHVKSARHGPRGHKCTVPCVDDIDTCLIESLPISGRIDHDAAFAAERVAQSIAPAGRSRQEHRPDAPCSILEAAPGGGNRRLRSRFVPRRVKWLKPWRLTMPAPEMLSGRTPAVNRIGMAIWKTEKRTALPEL